MKRAKKLYQTGAVLLAVLLALPLFGCVRDKRFDYSELNLRLRERSPAYGFAEADLFFADDVYYCLYTLEQPDDVLLTMRQDAEQKLVRVTLTLAAPPEDGRFDAFRQFALALAEVFIPDADTDALRESLQLDDPAGMRQKTLCEYTQGFYSASAFAAEKAVCVILRYTAGDGA